MILFFVGLALGILTTCAGVYLTGRWAFGLTANIGPHPDPQTCGDGTPVTGDDLKFPPGDRSLWSLPHVHVDPGTSRWLTPDEITFEDQAAWPTRGPTTHYPPGTPPLIDTDTLDLAADAIDWRGEYRTPGYVEPLPGLTYPRCSYEAMQRRCCQTAGHFGQHHLVAERTLRG